MAMQAERKQAYDSPTIPDRLYFKIGDVARICGLEAYVLRFWETQFPQLKPNKSGTGQRLYRRRDVELVLEIKRLVHGEGYTIAGARQALEQAQRGNPRNGAQPVLPLSARAKPDTMAAAVASARAELRQIASLLAGPPAAVHMRRRPRFFTGGSGNLFSS